MWFFFPIYWIERLQRAPPNIASMSFFFSFCWINTSSNWWSGGRQVQVILIFLRLEAVLVHWLAGRCCLYSSWSVGSVETTELLPDRGRGQDTHHNSRTVCTEYWVLSTVAREPHNTAGSTQDITSATKISKQVEINRGGFYGEYNHISFGWMLSMFALLG